MKSTSVVFLLLIVIMSCDKVNRLSVEDYTWMPYEDNQVLVFKSNLGGMDTIFLLKKDTIYGYPEAQKFNGTITESLMISSYRTTSHKEGYKYLKNTFFSVSKNKEDRSVLTLRLTTKDVWFYTSGKSILIDDMAEQGFSTFRTAYHEYDDVLIFIGDNVYSGRDDFVMKVYWSKSKGLIRYDKKNGVYWELVDEM